jgi:hypothetical protein
VDGGHATPCSLYSAQRCMTHPQQGLKRLAHVWLILESLITAEHPTFEPLSHELRVRHYIEVSDVTIRLV